MKTARPLLRLAPWWGLLSAWDEVRSGLVQKRFTGACGRKLRKFKDMAEHNKAQ
jgi:hypothetical protein